MFNTDKGRQTFGDLILSKADKGLA